MAIHVINPNTVGEQAQALYNVTSTEGKNLINSFSATIESLKSHWKGSDAVANLTDLSKVYTEVTDLVKNLQRLIVSVNNDEILPLQREIIASGGSCSVGQELAFDLNMESIISVPTEATESWTDAAIAQDAQGFNNFPTTFQTFVDNLNSAKETLLNNWQDGSNRAQIVTAFDNFNNNVSTYKTQITTVRDNINTVAANKAKLM